MKVWIVNSVIEAAGGSRRIADELGLTPGAVRMWRHQGFIPGLRVFEVAHLAAIDPRLIPRRSVIGPAPADASDVA